MARACLIALLTTVVALVAPLAAEARTPCPAELTRPTALNVGQVDAAIFCLSNQIRAHHGLPVLRRDARLDAAATLHSLDMATRLFFAHVNLDGLDPTARAAAQGYPLGVGENIAYGYAHARSVVLGWMASAGHCRNILSGAVDLGVGTAVVGTPHYTQALGDHFTRPVDPAPAAGCPYTVDLDTLNAPAPPSAPPVPGQPAAPARPAASPAHTAATAATAKLTMRGLALSPRRLRAGRGATTITYTLSAPASVTVRVQRTRGGRYRTISGRLTQRGVAGANSLRFSGRLRGSALRPGRYRLLAVAKAESGTSTRTLRATFSIVR